MYRYNNTLDNDKNMGMKSSFEDEIVYSAFKNRTLFLYGEITDKTEMVFNHMLERLTIETKGGEKLPITIRISSGGGGAFSAFSIISSIESAINSGYQINTIGYGEIMSAAVPVLSSGSKGHRKTQRYSRWMIHDIGIFLMGSMRGEEISRLNMDMQSISSVYEELITTTSNMSQEQFRGHINKLSEFYFWGKDALELGFVDSLI